MTAALKSTRTKKGASSSIAPSQADQQRIKLDELLQALVDRGYKGNAYDRIEIIVGAGVRKVAKIPEDNLEEVIEWASGELKTLEG